MQLWLEAVQVQKQHVRHDELNDGSISLVGVCTGSTEEFHRRVVWCCTESDLSRSATMVSSLAAFERLGSSHSTVPALSIVGFYVRRICDYGW